jgi:hypothetical protein
MLLRNNAKRLITINGLMTEGGYTEFYDIKPGDNPPVDIPDHLTKSDFVKNLLNTGDLTRITPVETDSDDMENLRNEALLLGIKVDKKWDAARIQSEINKVNE